MQSTLHIIFILHTNCVIIATILHIMRANDVADAGIVSHVVNLEFFVRRFCLFRLVNIFDISTASDYF